MLGSAIATGVIGSAALAYAVRWPSCSWLAESVHRGVPGRNALALTFDDGPSESTPALLELLDRWQARATFFQCGANVRRLSPIARQVAQAGHEIGNHTDSHPYLHFKSPQFMAEEMTRAQASILEATNCAPVYFRPPFGVRWFGMGNVQRRLGLTGVMWSVIACDWKLDAEGVAERVLRLSKPGDIVCFHDGRETRERPDVSVMLRAINQVLPVWADRGIRFETVSQILCPTN